MRKLTYEEFEDRTQAVLRAHRIFIDSSVTNNISIAFDIYQQVLAEQDREVFLSTMIQGQTPITPLDAYARPTCPDCGADMRCRPLSENDEGWLTQWVCSNDDCDLVLNSEKSVDEWMAELRRHDESVRGA